MSADGRRVERQRDETPISHAIPTCRDPARPSTSSGFDAVEPLAETQPFVMPRVGNVIPGERRSFQRRVFRNTKGRKEMNSRKHPGFVTRMVT